MATQDYPRDRFDVIPPDLERVGAHRAPGRRGNGLIWVMWCAVAVVVIIGAGWLFLHVLGSGTVNDAAGGTGGTPTATPSVTKTATPRPTPTATPTPTPTATLVPSAPVAVLNGVGRAGLAAGAKTKLLAAGWTSVTTGDAPQTGVATTTVYYADPSERGIALGVAQSLGVTTVTQGAVTASVTAPVVVVLGADYAG